ncbi:hypothetical protein D3C78_1893670 [compost metagenome]
MFGATLIVPSGLIDIEPFGSGIVVVSVTSFIFTGLPFNVSLVKTLPTVVCVALAVIGAGVSSLATIANVGLAVQ